MLHSGMDGLVGNVRGRVQETLNLFNEKIRVARLDHDLIEAQVTGLIELPGVGITCRGNERNRPGRGIRLQLPGYVKPGDARQLEVENDQIRQQLLGLRKRIFPVARRRYPIAERSQVERPDVERIGIVVDDQDMRAAAHHNTSVDIEHFKGHAKRMRSDRRPSTSVMAGPSNLEGRATLLDMQPNLAQVLNTLAHEIRTPLAVSQGYLKLYLDGRLTNVEDTRKAFEQTRQALGTLATLCVDMGKVAALSEVTAPPGVPDRLTAADFVKTLRASAEVAGASWQGDAGDKPVPPGNHRDLAQAVAIVSKAAFDEAREAAHVVSTDGSKDLIVLAGTSESLAALQAGPDAANAKAVDFVKGGKGLKLIWAAFVLELHGVQTWSHSEHRASVAFRIPLGQA